MRKAGVTKLPSEMNARQKTLAQETECICGQTMAIDRTSGGKRERMQCFHGSGQKAMGFHSKEETHAYRKEGFISLC